MGVELLFVNYTEDDYLLHKCIVPVTGTQCRALVTGRMYDLQGQRASGTHHINRLRRKAAETILPRWNNSDKGGRSDLFSRAEYRLWSQNRIHTLAVPPTAT